MTVAADLALAARNHYQPADLLPLDVPTSTVTAACLAGEVPVGTDDCGAGTCGVCDHTACPEHFTSTESEGVTVCDGLMHRGCHDVMCRDADCWYPG